MILTREEFKRYKINVKLLRDLENRIKIVGERINIFLLNHPNTDWFEQIYSIDDYDQLMLPHCSQCGLISDELEERTSMGVYAGKYCSDECWQNSGYKDEEFDPTFAGESLEPEDY